MHAIVLNKSYHIVEPKIGDVMHGSLISQEPTVIGLWTLEPIEGGPHSSDTSILHGASAGRGIWCEHAVRYI